MEHATKEFLAAVDAKSEDMKKRILETKDEIKFTGTAHYVSENGDDANDGLTPKTAWKTNARVTNAELSEGDAVLFKRGEIFRGQIVTKPGITYAAYGEGEKPKIYGYEKNLADKSMWTLINAEKHIWKYNEVTPDGGTLVFNDGEKHSIKLIPSYIRGKFVLRDEPSKDFVMEDEMKNDLDLFCDCRSLMTTPPAEKPELFSVPNVNQDCRGDLFLRCDKGNPGEIFHSIEILPKRNTFAIRSNPNVHIDNLCIKYCGAHGIGGGGHVVGLHITNCEIGWIGGSIQHYNSGSPERCGIVTRYGNGVEIYGGCEDYVVDNCYVYEVYDAGLTHQVTASRTKDIRMFDVSYTNNLIENCVYSIEYFLSQTEGTKSLMKNYEISGNILRNSGYGWGCQRYNKDTPAHIKSWDSDNPAIGYKIHDNIFDRAAYRMLHIVTSDVNGCPEMYDNTYIQKLGMKLGQFGILGGSGKPYYAYDENAEKVITENFGEKNAKVYYID